MIEDMLYRIGEKYKPGEASEGIYRVFFTPKYNYIEPHHYNRCLCLVKKQPFFSLWFSARSSLNFLEQSEIDQYDYDIELELVKP